MLRLVLIALLAIFATPIKAETWPIRPLTMVVPFAAGGPMDAVARILQSALSDALQQHATQSLRDGIARIREQLGMRH
jgi:tripartite-type tricarboxylate transporter receptor subunit TctC